MVIIVIEHEYFNRKEVLGILIIFIIIPAKDDKKIMAGG
jgi:hypothetical protein